jgi:hypothetical protein
MPPSGGFFMTAVAGTLEAADQPLGSDEDDAGTR